MLQIAIHNCSTFPRSGGKSCEYSSLFAEITGKINTGDFRENIGQSTYLIPCIISGTIIYEYYLEWYADLFQDF